jgi:hypothetical protein
VLLKNIKLSQVPGLNSQPCRREQMECEMRLGRSKAIPNSLPNPCHLVLIEDSAFGPAS